MSPLSFPRESLQEEYEPVISVRDLSAQEAKAIHTLQSLPHILTMTPFLRLNQSGTWGELEFIGVVLLYSGVTVLTGHSYYTSLLSPLQWSE